MSSVPVTSRFITDGYNPPDMPIQPLKWDDDRLLMLDQRLLPGRVEWLLLRTWHEVADAIRSMAVRGAPAIGLAAAYGMALAAQRGDDRAEAAQGLAATRPTAVNLCWALNRIAKVSDWRLEPVLAEARAIESEEAISNAEIGRYGATLIPHGAAVLTICNTGSLATGGIGTALGIIRTAHEMGRLGHVFACETRPRQQGLKLTAYELLEDGIPFQVIADGAAATLMREGRVQLVVTGADRIAANGDTANKIGTYMLAALANFHGIPFIVAAPSSTIDPATADGETIPIEERDPEELTHAEGVAIAPIGAPVYNPAFDITPGALITAIVTERGVANPPYAL